MPLHSTPYTLPQSPFKSQNDANNKLFRIKTCIYHPKALLLHQNILKQLWNTNLVLDVVPHLFVSTRIPPNANAQAWYSHLLYVLIWLRNTPTNASAASACWSSLYKQSMFVVPNGIRVFPAFTPYTLHFISNLKIPSPCPSLFFSG